MFKKLQKKRVFSEYTAISDILLFVYCEDSYYEFSPYVQYAQKVKSGESFEVIDKNFTNYRKQLTKDFYEKLKKNDRSNVFRSFIEVRYRGENYIMLKYHKNIQSKITKKKFVPSYIAYDYYDNRYITNYKIYKDRNQRKFRINLDFNGNRYKKRLIYNCFLKSTYKDIYYVVLDYVISCCDNINTNIEQIVNNVKIFETDKNQIDYYNKIISLNKEKFETYVKAYLLCNIVASKIKEDINCKENFPALFLNNYHIIDSNVTYNKQLLTTLFTFMKKENKNDKLLFIYIPFYASFNQRSNIISDIMDTKDNSLNKNDKKYITGKNYILIHLKNFDKNYIKFLLSLKESHYMYIIDHKNISYYIDNSIKSFSDFKRGIDRKENFIYDIIERN